MSRDEYMTEVRETAAECRKQASRSKRPLQAVVADAVDGHGFILDASKRKAIAPTEAEAISIMVRDIMGAM